MNKDEYAKIVKKHTPVEPKMRNAIISFCAGGLLGVIAELLCNVFISVFHLSRIDAVTWIIIVTIFLACLLTCLHIFDNFVQKVQAGLIIPITGFAHSVCSSELEYKKDGLITGLGSNVFKLAGSVLLYGMVSAFILCMIKVVFYG